MLKRSNFFLLALVYFLNLNCATYKYDLVGYQIPVSFANETSKETKARKFRIEKKVTWVFFDLAKTEDLNLAQVLQQELPNAKKIYNLKIESEENPVDSFIRAATTAFRNWFIWFKPIISRRTIVITGDVIE